MLPLLEPGCPLAHTFSIAIGARRRYRPEVLIARRQLGGMWVPRQRDKGLAVVLAGCWLARLHRCPPPCGGEGERTLDAIVTQVPDVQ